MILFKEYKNQKKDSFSKYPKTYDKRENVNFEEQKANLVDDFTAEEQEALRLKSEARKRKRHAVAEKNKERKQKKKARRK